ncbi:hypothetical protein CPC08DRAFT_725408 [Agrocybe pediades]|nr:hypothetical protein CPC08DRAFT_725408 [Agrocybe pediades]
MQRYPHRFSPNSVQSSWTSSKGRKDVDTVKRQRTDLNNSHVSQPRYGIEDYNHEMETYIKRVKDIGAGWRRTDLDSCGSDDMLWLDVIDVLNAGLDRLPYKYHRGAISNGAESSYETYGRARRTVHALNPIRSRMEGPISLKRTLIFLQLAMFLWTAKVGLKAASLN